MTATQRNRSALLHDSAGDPGMIATPTDRTSDPVAGGIDRLAAFDGLFLRAEHLDRIQSYARDLSCAVGQAAGSGVVYGFDVLVQDNELRVTPGLAVNRQGRPMRSGQMATVSLDNLVADPDGFWVVELVPESTPFGDETVYGVLCEDPCSGGASVRPFVSEGIRVRLTPDTAIGLDAIASVGRRGWLASRLFERERRNAGPWLTPVADPRVAALNSRPWNTGAPQPQGTSVPIAVLLRSGDAWEVDTWTARRETGDPWPVRVWQWRLGMRPSDVFVAQILQFQDLLTLRYPASSGHAAKQLRRRIEAQLAANVPELADYAPLLQSLQVAVESQARSLPDLGIDEVPPAGYLPIAGYDAVEAQVTTLLGEYVNLRFCRCRPDFVPHAVESVQHMDRIVLNDPGRVARVDVLVPVLDEGPSADTEAPHGWVAFVRRREADCGPPPTDPVEVYVVDDDSDQGVMRQVESGEVPYGAEFLTTTTYPPGTWAVPPRDVFDRLHRRIGSRKFVTLVGLASAEDRRPLAAVRAGMLVATFDDKMVRFKLKTALRSGGGVEAIVAVLSERRDRGCGDAIAARIAHTEQSASPPAEPAPTEPASEPASAEPAKPAPAPTKSVPAKKTTAAPRKATTRRTARPSS